MANDVRIILSAEDRTKATIESMIGRLGDVSTAGSLASNALRGLTAALSVGALIASTRATIDHADALNDMAERTGLAGDKLSELEYAARLNGTSLEDVETALKKLSVKALDAAQGGKQAAAMFDALGVAVSGADGSLRNSDELMTEIASVLNQVQDRTLRTALAVEVFGKSGDKLIPLFENMQASRQEAQRLGAVIGVDFQKASAQFNDDLDRMILMSRAFGVNLANEVLPTLQRFITELIAGRSIFGGYWEAAKNIGTTNPFATPAENAETYRNKLEEIKTQLMMIENRGPEMDRNMGPGYSTGQIKKLNEELRNTQRLVDYFQRLNGQTSTGGAGRGSVNPPSPNAANGADILGRLRAANNKTDPATANSFEAINASLDKYLQLNQAALAAETELSATERLRVSTLAELEAKRLSGNLTLKQAIELEEKLSRVVTTGLAAEALDKARKNAAAAYKSAEAAAASYNKTLADGNLSAERAVTAAEDELAAIGLLKSGVQALTLAKMQAQLEAGNLTQAETDSINLRIDAQKRLIGATQALEATKSAQDRQAGRNAEYEGIRQFIADQEALAFATAATAEANAAAARAELDNFGKTKSQLAEITLLRLQDKQVNQTAGTALYTATQRQIEAQQELIAALKTGEARDAGTKSAQDRQAARNAEFEGIRQFFQDQETAAQTAARTAQATTAAAQAEFDAFGKTKSQLAELTLARLRDSQVNLTVGTVAYDATQRQIEAQQQLIGILKKGELRDAALDAADKAEKAWRQTADSINASLTDALLRGFESGKDFGQNFADTLENMLKTAILRPLLAKVFDPISMAVSTGITSLLGFEGGGYTGPGLRTGGLDGRGGFMALLHPNETVIDHTQGGSAGAGQAVTVVQNFTVGDVASVSLVRQAVANSERRIAASIGRSMNYGGAIA
jgi:hypothetical protein